LDAACYPNATCNAGLRCINNVCTEMLQEPTRCIVNGMKDGAEDGIDCGRSCAVACSNLDSGMADVALETTTPTLQRCGDLKPGSKTGVYRIDPPGQSSFETVCDTSMPGGPWALVYRTTGKVGSTPITFWKIPYADRFQSKGLPNDAIFYGPAAYKYGLVYRDLVVDEMGVSATLFEAQTSGLDALTMKFNAPMFVSGVMSVFNSQFAAGWSSLDYDNDSEPTYNCAVAFSGITQHYSTCWNYNLAVDDEGKDLAWGPHVIRSALVSLSLYGDPAVTYYPRVKEITRWTKW
jgi:hypothetical protein